ncbi:MAG: hypothetical protein ACFNWZ_01395 [Candidatus Absconditicoccaceae bacterium]
MQSTFLLVPTPFRPPDKNRTLVPTSFRPPDKNRTLVPTLKRAFPLFPSLRATEGKRGNPVTSHPSLRAKRGNPHSSSAKRTEKVIISCSLIGEEEVRESFFDFAPSYASKELSPLFSSLRATEGKRGNPHSSSARLKSHKAERRDQRKLLKREKHFSPPTMLNLLAIKPSPSPNEKPDHTDQVSLFCEKD